MYSMPRRVASLEWRWLPICANTFVSIAFFARWRASATDQQSGFCTYTCLPSAHRVRRDHRVHVVGRRHDDRVDVLLLLEHLAVVAILLHARQLLVHEPAQRGGAVLRGPSRIRGELCLGRTEVAPRLRRRGRAAAGLPRAGAACSSPRAASRANRNRSRRARRCSGSSRPGCSPRPCRRRRRWRCSRDRSAPGTHGRARGAARSKTRLRRRAVLTNCRRVTTGPSSFMVAPPVRRAVHRQTRDRRYANAVPRPPIRKAASARARPVPGVQPP